MNSFRVILFFFILPIFSKLSAQEKTGQIITSRLDTLSGVIEFPRATDSHDQVVLKEGKKRKYYKAYEIRSVSVNDQNYYPVKSGDVYKIMLLETEGYLSKYRYRPERSSDFASTYLVKKDGTGTDSPNPLFFKSAMKNFLGDCSIIVNRLDNGKYKMRDIDQMVDDYNSLCISDSESIQEELTAEAPKNPPVKSSVKTPVSELLESTQDEELKPLLSDIQDKIESKSEIPSYLIEVLKGKISEKTKLDPLVKYLQNYNSSLK